MTNRTRHLTTFTSCAAIALLAGAAMGQPRDMYQSRQDSSMHMSQSGDWKSAHSLKTNADVVLAGKTHDGRDVNVIFSQGRLTSAEIDQNLIDPNRVQMKGDRIRIVDRDGQSNLVTFTLPRHLAMGSDMGMRSDRFSDTQFRDSRFRDSGFRDDRSFQGQQFQGQQFRSSQRPSQPSFQGDRFQDTRFQSERLREDRSYTPPQQRTFTEQRTTRVYGTDFDSQPMQLGISMSDASRSELARLDTQTTYTRGIRVERVHSGTPAERAGLRSGDIIVRVDDQAASTDLLQRKLSQKSAGEPLNLRIVRDGRERNLNIHIDSATTQSFGVVDPWQSAAPPVQPELPNVQHPGPFNEYRPTQPDWTGINRDRTFWADRDASDRDTRFRDDRFYGTDDRVTEFRSERYEFDTRPQFRDDTRYRDDSMYRNEGMYRDNRIYRSNEFRDDLDSPRLRIERDSRGDIDTYYYNPRSDRSDRLQWESNLDDGRIQGTYRFDDDNYSTRHHDFGSGHTYDMREGRIYGTDDRLYGTMDYDPVYVERSIEIRESDPDVYYFDDTPGLPTPSTKFHNYDMPNIEHPGPFNTYRPTQPSQNELPRR